MNSSESIPDSGEPVAAQQLTINEKLKIAIETLLTGKLKDNHDDTLFEKFCSLLQSDIEVHLLVKFVSEQKVFELINANLPLFQNAEYVGKHRDDIIAFFRLLGALLSHEETFNLYLAGKENTFDIGQIFSRLIPLFIDQKCEDSMLLVYSMLSFTNYISDHKSGAQWLMTLWFDAAHEDESKFALYFVPFAKSENTHYIQKEIYSLLGNLIDFNEGSPTTTLYDKFHSTIKKHLLSPFDLPECKLATELMVTIQSDKKTFIHQHNLIDLTASLLKRSSLNGDELIYLTKLICLIVDVYCDDLSSVSHLLDLTIATLHSSSHCFALLSFLGLAINVIHPAKGFKSIRGLWFALMTKLLSLVKSHYFGVDIQEADIVDDHDQLVVHAFHSMPYTTFEFNCLRLLNRIDCQLLTSGDVLLLTEALKALIVKLKNRKHTIFVVTFFDEVVKAKCNQADVVTEILAIYCEMLHKMPLYRSLILKSIRTIFQQSSSLIGTEAVLEKICPILNYFLEYLTESDHDFDDSELADIIIETMFHLLLHLDLNQISQSGTPTSETFQDLLKQIIEFESTLLSSDNVEPSTRANLVSSLFCISRYRSKSPSLLLPLTETTILEEQLCTSYDYDCTYRQSLYGNLKDIFTGSAVIDSSEVRFLLPLLCKFCMEESDTELECILLQMIKLICGALLDCNKDDAIQSAQCFLESGLFTLIYCLLGEPLIMYRTKVATLTLHENVCTQLKAHFSPDQTSSKKLDFSRGCILKEVPPETAFTFCMSTNGDLRRSVEQQRDCPHVSILDDIISTSLAEARHQHHTVADMNPYGYGYAEPVVPPRRKRSLSTSRTDPTITDDSFGFPNRMRRNFSTDHIPNDYMYGNGPRPLGNGPMGNYYMSPQHLPSQYRQPYNSSGNLYSPMQPPGLRMANPVPFQVPNSKVPIRPHQDYLKYAQGANVPYNPYSPSFNPTLMARPTIEPFQSTVIPTSIASARGRDSALYSSKEHLQSGQMNSGDYRRDMSMGHGFHGKTPPERPPPPRYSAGLSNENLADYELDMNSRHLRDRRSVSPSRFSQTEQKPYNVRRSTSPMPSALNSRSPELPLSRSGSRTSLNHNYGSPLRMSRESSPLLASSPYSFATNHSSAHEYKPLTRTASNSKYTSRSSILGNSSSRTPHSFVSGLFSPSGHNSSSIASNANNSDSLRTTSNSVLPKGGLLNVDANSKTISSSVDEANFNRHMDTLQVPNGHDDAANRNGNVAMTVPRQMDRQFSESFTDHCDQYKSLTSKILGMKGNRRSGDFSDVNLEPLETDNTIRKSSFSPSFTPDTRDYDNCYENHEPTDAFFANEVFENPVDLFDTLLQPPQSTQPTQPTQPSPMRNDVSEIRGQSPKPADNLLKQLAAPAMRRSSSSNGLAGQQRKGSLPSDYISNANSMALSNEWSREKVADMAHQARQRLQNHPNSTSTTFKKIGTWFTRQFVFLLIAGLNILLAYVFYNLLAMLPIDDTVRK